MKKTMFFKVITLMISVAVLFTACEKDEPANNTEGVEVEFVIHQTDFGNLKSTTEEVPECSDLPWSYVKFTIDNVDYTSNILHVGDDILTQAVKLPAGVTYQLTEFLVYSDVLPVGEGPEDELIRAAPAVDSEYWDLMENPLNVDVEVFEFSKRQVVVDVLCFEDLQWEAFGFNWFEMNDVKIERQCFFGDVCTGKLGDFAGSLYEDQSQGLQMDMPAIFKIRVYKKSELIRTFSNEGDFGWNPDTQEFDGYRGEGACLEVYWANDLDVEEEFSFALYVLLPEGSSTEYMLIDSIPFLDDNCPDPGLDGVVDFTIGNCNIGNPGDAGYPDIVYPAWMDLPNFPIKMKVGSTYGPGPLGTYFDITLSQATGHPAMAGFDVANGDYGIWCGDKDATIYLGNTYTVDVLSSLAPLPGDFTITPEELNKINWLFNNLSTYTEFNDINLFDMASWTGANPGKWAIIQNAIWALKGEIAPPAGLATTMFNDAQPWENYRVLPGEWAAVLFWDNPQVQVLFLMVDP